MIKELASPKLSDSVALNVRLTQSTRRVKTCTLIQNCKMSKSVLINFKWIDSCYELI